MRRAAEVMMVAAMTAAFAGAQTPGAANSGTAGDGFQEITRAEMNQRAAELLKKAQASPSGLGTVTLDKYPGHFTMLTVRTKSGGAEQHDHADDMFIVLSGEATEITGGTIADVKTSSPGELRGSRVVGGTEHAMRPGDVIHISAGTPHQTTVAPGQTFTYFVIKFQH